LYISELNKIFWTTKLLYFNWFFSTCDSCCCKFTPNR